MTQVLVESEITGTAPMEFRRTVDRKLAHRAAVSEVFVTDVRPITDRSCLVGAQLPQSHSYYSDHTSETELADVLLVLETCRQAAIVGAHEAAEIPTGESMLVDNFTVQLTDPSKLVVSGAPVELTLRTTYIGEAGRNGRVRQGRVEHELLVDDDVVGNHAMDVVFVRGRQHEALRRAQRGSVPPSTTDMAMPDLTRMVTPGLVGRAHPRNVVLSSPVVNDGVVTADVTPRPDNRGLFDHAYDHLPAMTLSEAARQLALLSIDGGSGNEAGRALAVGLRSKFLKFAELDAPIQVSTAVRPAGPLGARTDVDCIFVQSGTPVAEATVTLIPSDRVEQ